MNKHTILITGSTGGIGTELCMQLLAEGHELHMPVRSIKKAEQFAPFQNAHPIVCDLEDYDEVERYTQSVKEEGIVFDLVLLLAGDLRKDDDAMFTGDTAGDKETQSIAYHYQANVVTADTVVRAVQKVFAGNLSNMRLLVLSSWAAHFAVDNPFRINEEGYVRAKAMLSEKFNVLKSQGIFNEVFIEEPSLIVSPLTMREFPELINDPSVQKLLPEQYVKHLREILKV